MEFLSDYFGYPQLTLNLDLKITVTSLTNSCNRILCGLCVYLRLNPLDSFRKLSLSSFDQDCQKKLALRLLEALVFHDRRSGNSRHRSISRFLPIKHCYHACYVRPLSWFSVGFSVINDIRLALSDCRSDCPDLVKTRGQSFPCGELIHDSLFIESRRLWFISWLPSISAVWIKNSACIVSNNSVRYVSLYFILG
uniref:Uncharacterized protein n=1 Tax=Sipha flava TaxID=143950 RepID=A0A2S2QUP8_9HEMI